MPDQDLARSMGWFGIAGFFIGLALAFAYLGLSLFLPKIVISALIVLFMAVVSRGLHLDGLADTIDGLTGGKNRADILRIMHDPNIGAAGAAAIFTCLLVKFSCIYSISDSVVPLALVASSVLSRWAFVYSAVKWAPAPNNDGLGRKFIKYASRKELFLASFTALPVIFWPKGILIIIFAAVLVYVFNRYIKNNIGGLTGDTIGAVGELVECLSLVIISIK